MKTLFQFSSFLAIGILGVLVLTSLKYAPVESKDLIGAWEYGTSTNKTVMIKTDKVFSVATYDFTGKKFISSYGGTWKVDGNNIVTKIEWNSLNKEQVNKELSYEAQLLGGKLLNKTKNETWSRVDDGKPGVLMGAWIITGNFADDKASKRAAPFYPKRTMKILSGTRFHWIAYNIETKEFTNAGGGSYTTENGKYTENIEFFTKTAESVGKSLSFQYSFVNGDWRHKGEKSTGGPIDECWSRREILEK